jgi:hypothetical protein
MGEMHGELVNINRTNLYLNSFGLCERLGYYREGLGLSYKIQTKIH